MKLSLIIFILVFLTIVVIGLESNQHEIDAFCFKRELKPWDETYCRFHSSVSREDVVAYFRKEDELQREDMMNQWNNFSMIEKAGIALLVTIPIILFWTLLCGCGMLGVYF